MFFSASGNILDSKLLNSKAGIDYINNLFDICCHETGEDKSFWQGIKAIKLKESFFDPTTYRIHNGAKNFAKSEN